MDRVFVISPHADDETLGCGGAIAKWCKAGARLEVLCCTDEGRKRRTQFYEAMKILGTITFHTLDYPDNTLDQVSLSQIVDDIRKHADLFLPNILLMPSRNDAHTDHKIIADAAFSLTKPGRYAFKLEKILTYEVLSQTEIGRSTFEPNVFIDITKEIDKKLEAYGKYDTECVYPRTVDNIKVWAKMRGIQCGVQYAEAFSLIREIK